MESSVSIIRYYKMEEKHEKIAFPVTSQPFCEATGTLCFGLWLTLLMGFKDRDVSSIAHYDPQNQLWPGWEMNQ